MRAPPHRQFVHKMLSIFRRQWSSAAPPTPRRAKPGMQQAVWRMLSGSAVDLTPRRSALRLTFMLLIIRSPPRFSQACRASPQARLGIRLHNQDCRRGERTGPKICGETTGLPPFAQDPESFGWRCDRLQQIDPDQPVRRSEVGQISLLDQPFRHLEVLLLEREPSGQQGATLCQRLRVPVQKGASAPIPNSAAIASPKRATTSFDDEDLKYSHVRHFKQQARKIFACLFQAVQHGRRWAKQEARS